MSVIDVMYIRSMFDHKLNLIVHRSAVFRNFKNVFSFCSSLNIVLVRTINEVIVKTKRVLPFHVIINSI